MGVMAVLDVPGQIVVTVIPLVRSEILRPSTCRRFTAALLARDRRIRPASPLNAARLETASKCPRLTALKLSQSTERPRSNK